uniref:Putative secreted peptide n=1 Tax=Anopheles braziliensis TaxID=58242 RepID=A0A2M3ZUP1_9DIPT
MVASWATILLQSLPPSPAYYTSNTVTMVAHGNGRKARASAPGNFGDHTACSPRLEPPTKNKPASQQM